MYRTLVICADYQQQRIDVKGAIINIFVCRAMTYSTGIRNGQIIYGGYVIQYLNDKILKNISYLYHNISYCIKCQPLNSNPVNWNVEHHRPPLPPKGDAFVGPAPVPPPRRHKMMLMQQQQSSTMRQPMQFNKRQQQQWLGSSSTIDGRLQLTPSRNSEPFSHEDENPPTPPPVSTIPVKHRSLTTMSRGPPQMQSQMSLNDRTMGQFAKNSKMLMSYDNLRSAVTKNNPAPMLGIRTQPVGSFPQQHLVQKPIISRPIRQDDPRNRQWPDVPNHNLVN
jgi:hypothetical protein